MNRFTKEDFRLALRMQAVSRMEAGDNRAATEILHLLADDQFWDFYRDEIDYSISRIHEILTQWQKKLSWHPKAVAVLKDIQLWQDYRESFQEDGFRNRLIAQTRGHYEN
jgi:hypothetical protein